VHWRHQPWGTGTRAPLNFQLFNFFWSLQSCTNRDIGLYVVGGCLHRKNILAYSFVTVCCTDFACRP